MVSLPPIRVALFDDHRMLSEALTGEINSQSDMEVVGTACESEEAFQLLENSPADVVVIDVELPGRGSFGLSHAIPNRFPGTECLFLSNGLSDCLLEHALLAGSKGYLTKTEPVKELLTAIRTVAAGGLFFSELVRSRLMHDTQTGRYTVRSETQLGKLTPQQFEVLRHLARGASVKEISKIMRISGKSVENHKYRIMHKLGIHDRVELARFAIREGLTLP